MKTKILFGLGLALLTLFVAGILNKNANALIRCSVTVSPSSVTGGSSNTFNFSFSGGAAYNVVKITSPDPSLFSITGGSASGWTGTNTFSAITFTGGSYTVTSFNVNAYSPNTTSGPVAWTVDISTDGGGSFVACSGTLTTSIVAPTPTFTPTPTSTPPATPTPTPDLAPVISNLTVSDVTSSSVKVSWNTDKPATTVVDYGLTSSYGQEISDPNFVTSHSVTITSLTANTTYHYDVISIDALNTLASSGDNTFVAAQANSTATTTVTVTNTVTVTPTPTPTPVPDTIPPSVSISTDFSKPFSYPPQITGTASDNKEVSKIEYSINAGKDWLPIDSAPALGKAYTAFSFTPPPLDDGNYLVRVKAIDSSGNVGLSKEYTMVIDRIPPRVSGVLFSLGPQVIAPSEEGIITALSGQSVKLTLSEVGGSIAVNIIASDSGNLYKNFSLVKNPEDGLWSGNIALPQGQYQLIFSAVDGAGNKTVSYLNKLYVLGKGDVTSALGGVFDAKITVYYLEPSSGTWQVWDGSPYGQQNPLQTDASGHYSLFLPPGRFYLHIDAGGFHSGDSNFFTLTKAEPINANFLLSPLKLLFSLGPVKLYYPDFSNLTLAFKNNLPAQNSSINKLVSSQAPYFNLSNVSPDSLKGKPSVVSFINLWSPYSSGQISILNDLHSDQNYNSVIIVEGEKSAAVDVFAKSGGYSIPFIADPDATLFNTYGLSVLPTHYFIDRKGVVREVVTGVLSKTELENILTNVSQ